jgi:predicted transcriptional regulator
MIEGRPGINPVLKHIPETMKVPLEDNDIVPTSGLRTGASISLMSILVRWKPYCYDSGANLKVYVLQHVPGRTASKEQAGHS